MHIAVGQKSYQLDDIPKSHANNLWHHRFFPFALDNKGGEQNVVSFCTKSLGKQT